VDCTELTGGPYVAHVPWSGHCCCSISSNLHSYITWYYNINIIVTDTTFIKSGIESHSVINYKHGIFLKERMSQYKGRLTPTPLILI
jgi:hypothetical protein